MPWSSISIGAVESHRFLVDPSMKRLSRSNGVPLEGPQYAVISHDAHTELESTVRHLFVDITTSTTVSQQVYDALSKLLQQQEPAQAFLFTFQPTVSYSGGIVHNHRVLTVYPLTIVSHGAGTYIVERTPDPQTEQAYAIFEVYSANPSTAQGRF
ncbi:MAG: hypothetical protein JO202_09070 [Ktedonobacteraceae bacterium]|nr:hypothetical protein [Ktedonobacteraceae bacterium]